MEVSFLTIKNFEKLMKSSLSLRKSFEKCIKDMRRQTKFEYTDILKEATNDTRTTKIFIIHTQTECIFITRVLTEPGNSEINMVYTNPSYRHQGYCVNSLKKIIKKLRANEIYLTVNKNNKAAIHCYETVGFVNTKSIGTLIEMTIEKNKT